MNTDEKCGNRSVPRNFFDERSLNETQSIELAVQKLRIVPAPFASIPLIKRFNGKNQLIDIWATWCHPCVEDFKHKASILPFVENEQLEILRADDWIVFLVIDCISRKQSVNVEDHIKRMKSRRYIENLKKYPEIIIRLKLKYPE